MIDLSGRVALVTGSSRGIGEASALRLAEAGADVIVNYLTSKAAAIQTAEKIRAMGRRTAVVRADISEEDDVSSMMNFIQEEFGKLDILVSNAASGGFRPLLASTARHFTNTMNINTLALVLLVQRALPLLEKSAGRGKVIALSSHGADTALPWYGLIGASKAALESIARHLTLEVGDRGVNVNIIRAGLVETDSTRQIPNADEIFARRIEKTMMSGRMLTGADIADAVLFLASPLSDMIQGETLVVDGGAAIHI
jgi:enoyl-[acyl-carrier protein] reductase III